METRNIIKIGAAAALAAGMGCSFILNEIQHRKRLEYEQYVEAGKAAKVEQARRNAEYLRIQRSKSSGGTIDPDNPFNLSKAEIARQHREWALKHPSYEPTLSDRLDDIEEKLKEIEQEQIDAEEAKD